MAYTSKYTGAQIDSKLDGIPTVADTYSPTSRNAMSGKAVASAISATLGDIDTVLTNILS